METLLTPIRLPARAPCSRRFPAGSPGQEPPTLIRSRLRRLHAELQACQERLGTPAEAADDFARARALAHEINNHLQASYLQAALRTLCGR